MAYSKVNNTTYANLAKVNNVAKANIAKIDNVDVPSSGATYWVGLQDDAQVSWALNANLSTNGAAAWTSYDGDPTASDTDFVCLAYGKNGSGGAHWVGTFNRDSTEIGYSANPKDGNTWTTVNVGAKVFELVWGNDVWIGIGKMNGGSQQLVRSTDGINWTDIDLTGVTNISTTSVFALTTNKAGTWWFGQDDFIFQSTNNGQTWASVHQFGNTGDIDNLAFTNNTLVAISGGYIYAAAASDVTDWSSGVQMASAGNSRHLCSSAGRVCVALSAFFWTFDVNGKTITGYSADISNGILGRTDISTQSHSGALTINTDGTTWMIGCQTGDVFWTTDPVDENSFSDYILNLNGEDLNDLKPDVILPL